MVGEGDGAHEGVPEEVELDCVGQGRVRVLLEEDGRVARVQVARLLHAEPQPPRLLAPNLQHGQVTSCYISWLVMLMDGGVTTRI